ncbi:MAG: hypothetical protein R2742_03345 [Micropruina glycogenica]
MFTRAVTLAIDKGSRVVVLGLNGVKTKTTLLRILGGGIETPTPVRCSPATACGSAITRRSTGPLDVSRSVLEHDDHGPRRSKPAHRRCKRFRRLVSAIAGDDVDSRRGCCRVAKTRLALAAMLVVSAANVLLLDRPTNNLDPASPGRDS